MSIQDEINRINQNVSNTYSALSDMGATMPETQNSDNLSQTVSTLVNLPVDSTPIAGSQNLVTSDGIRKAIDAVNNTFVFEAVASVSTSGLSFSLAEGITHALLVEKINAGYHVVSIATLPEAAGDKAGTYVLPFTHDWQGGGSAQDDLYFSTTVINTLIYVAISSDDSVIFRYYDIERQDNKVTAVSASSTDTQYPTVKAVYDFVVAQTGGLTFKVANTVPTVDNRSVMTIVL